MSISIENIADCKRKVTIEIPADEIQQKQQQKIKEFKGAEIKGFRAGKAPIELVLNRMFGGLRQFRSSVVQDLLQEKFSHAVKLHDIDLIDAPELEELNDSGDGAVTFSTICEVYPEFELVDFAGLELERKDLTLTEEEYQQKLEEVLVNHGVWESVEDHNYIAKSNDKVTLEFTLVDKEHAGDDVAKKLVEIVLNDNMRYGFEKGLYGMHIGQSKDITDESKDKTFHVNVLTIESNVKAEADDALATKIGVHCAHDIRAHIEKGIKEYADDVAIKSARAQLLDMLVEMYKDLPIPDKLLERYRTAMNQGEFNAANMGPSGTSPEQQVRRAVILDLLRAKIAKKFELTVDNDRVIDLIMKLALSTFGNYDLVMDLYSKHPVLLNQVKTLVLDEQITKLVLAQAKVHVENLSLAEIEKLDQKA